MALETSEGGIYFSERGYFGFKVRIPTPEKPVKKEKTVKNLLRFHRLDAIEHTCISSSQLHICPTSAFGPVLCSVVFNGVGRRTCIDESIDDLHSAEGRVKCHHSFNIRGSRTWRVGRNVQKAVNTPSGTRCRSSERREDSGVPQGPMSGPLSCVMNVIFLLFSFTMGKLRCSTDSLMGSL